jgi:regulator of sigma E protease
MDFSTALSKIIPFAIAVLFFGVIIFIHEFGHFFFAKLFGVKVNEFAIGMGPAFIKRTNQKTGEVFSVRLLPLGGYCAFAGEDNEEDDVSYQNTFYKKER